MKIAEATVVRLLKQHKVNTTRNRIDILSAISNMEGNICASRVVQEAGLNTDRVTIYRTLQDFQRKGLLQLVPNTNGKVEFCFAEQRPEEPPDTPAGVQWECKECGSQRVVELPGVLSVCIPGFDTHEILLKGFCETCLLQGKAF